MWNFAVRGTEEWTLPRVPQPSLDLNTENGILQVFNRFLFLTFARFRQPRTMQTSAQKRDAEFCRIFKQKSSIGIFSYAQIKMRHVLKKK